MKKLLFRQTSFAVLAVALLAYGHAATIGASDSDTALTAHLIKLRTGVTLEYVTQGRADGQPIVFLHGGGDSWHSWLRVYPRIPAKYHVYSVTLRGHGLSDHPPTGYSRLDFANDIVAFLDQLHIEKPVIVGHSLGTLVAQAVAVIAPDHVSKLVLVGAPAELPKTDAVKEISERTANPDKAVDANFARDFQFSTVFNPLPADFAEIVVKDAQQLQDYVWHELGKALAADHFVDQISKIKAPTLLLWGDRDTLVDRAQEDLLLSKITSAKLKVYPNTGHGLHWEKPEEFTQDLLAFISR
jgi:pimeloyl-ACP methyl ester carboxylesterase